MDGTANSGGLGHWGMLQNDPATRWRRDKVPGASLPPHVGWAVAVLCRVRVAAESEQQKSLISEGKVPDGVTLFVPNYYELVSLKMSVP